MASVRVGISRWAAVLLTMIATVVAALTAAQVSAQAGDCSSVTTSLAPCVSFLTQGNPMPAVGDGCCSGVQGLLQQGSSQAARQSICRCLASAATTTFTGRLLPASMAALPALCQLSFPFPPTPVQDCSQIS